MGVFSSVVGVGRAAADGVVSAIGSVVNGFASWWDKMMDTGVSSVTQGLEKGVHSAVNVAATGFEGLGKLTPTIIAAARLEGRDGPTRRT